MFLFRFGLDFLAVLESHEAQVVWLATSLALGITVPADDADTRVGFIIVVDTGIGPSFEGVRGDRFIGK